MSNIYKRYLKVISPETPSPIAATVPRILPKLKSRETPSTTAARCPIAAEILL
jgi:hypothetical protein